MQQLFRYRFVLIIVALGIALLASILFYQRDFFASSRFQRLGIVEFSPDRRLVAANSFRGLEIIDVREGIVMTLNDYAKQAAFSPDMKYLATYDDDSATIFIWDLTANPPKKISQLPFAGASEFIWAPDSPSLIIARMEELVSWNIMNGHYVSVSLETPNIGQPPNYIHRSLYIRPGKDGGNILYMLNRPYFDGGPPYGTPFYTGHIAIYDFDSLALREIIPLPSDTDRWQDMLSSDGRLVVKWNDERSPTSFSFYDLEQQKFTHKIESGYYNPTPIISDDGKLFAVLLINDTINIWDIETERIKYHLTTFGPRFEYGSPHFAFLPDGKGLLVARDRSVCIHSLEDGGQSVSCVPLNIHPTYQWMVMGIVLGVLLILLWWVRRPVALPDGVKVPNAIIVSLITMGIVLSDAYVREQIIFVAFLFWLFNIQKSEVFVRQGALPLAIIASTLAGGVMLFGVMERAYGHWFPFITTALPARYYGIYRSSWQWSLEDAIIYLPLAVCIVFRVIRKYSDMPDDTWKIWLRLSKQTLIVSGITLFLAIGRAV